MGKFRQLINPHSHCDSSIDGASTISQIVRRNLELGASHVAVTDHGTMAGIAELVAACEKQGAKPIPGIELYLENPFKDEARRAAELRWDKNDPKGLSRIEKSVDESYVHLTAHFRSEAAYQAMCRLTPRHGESCRGQVG
jgi:DNA polymerase III alpha subunit